MIRKRLWILVSFVAIFLVSGLILTLSQKNSSQKLVADIHDTVRDSAVKKLEAENATLKKLIKLQIKELERCGKISFVRYE